MGKTVTAEIKEIPLANLHLPDFQRTNEERSERLRFMRREGWNEAKAQIPDVIENSEGQYLVLDGFTRVSFAMEVGKDRITCRVIHGLTYNQAIETYVRLQTDRTRVNAEQRYRADRARKDPLVRSIDKAAINAGATVDVKPVSRGPFGIVCHDALVKLARKKDGAEILEKAIRALVEAFPSGGRRTWDALTRWHLEGVFGFIQENPDYNHQKLVSGLSALDHPNRVQQDAEAMWAAENKKAYAFGLTPTKRPRDEHYQRAIAKLYKRGRVRK